MVIAEIREFEEEKRTATAVTQAKQCAWTTWGCVEPMKLTWNTLMAMEPLAISFLLRSTYDLLPNATYLKLWGYTSNDICGSCKSNRGTLNHVLSACPKSLPMYTWRHNKILEVLRDLIKTQCEANNRNTLTSEKMGIQFLKEGERPVRKKTKISNLLNGARDWKICADVGTRLHFPVHIVRTHQRPDIVVWSDAKKCVLIIELTVPWEGNIEAVHEQKSDRYEDLRSDCIEKGWSCHVLPIEVGCRGYIAQSVVSFLSKIGISGLSLRRALNELKSTAQQSSNWIWLRANQK